MSTLPTFAHVVLVGIGATAFLDAWLLALARLGLPASNFALVGRWVGHMPRGRFVHAAIARAEPVASERVLGWAVHYTTGIAFAALLAVANGLGGHDWLERPTLLPALAWGLATVAAPLFVMQPAMGAGFASTRTAAPLKNCLRSALNHLVFGAGLYVAAAVIASLLP